MKLTLCMIVKNEMQALPRCLESVRSAVEEVVILDTGSTDGTPEMARSVGAQVHTFEWCHDFSVARNECLKYATGDWILVLDADEVLVPEAVPAIRQAIQPDRHLVVNLVRQEIGAAQSPYSLVSRLFRRHPDLYFTRPYHAMIDDSVVLLRQREPDWQIVDLPQVAIWHEGYRPDVIASQDKLARAKAAMSGFLVSHPHDPYVCSKLGALYVQEGNLTEGLDLLKRGLETATDPIVLYELHYHLGIAYTQSQQLHRAALHYRTSLRQPVLSSLQLGAYVNLASLLQQQGNLAEAEQLYRTALQIDPTFAIAHFNLGLLLKTTNQLRAAIEAYHQAIRYKPDYAEAYQNLGVALFKNGNLPESQQAFQQAIALYEQRHSPEADRLRQGLAELGFILK